MAIRGYVLESIYDESTGPRNVAYRIIAPIVWDYFFLLVSAILLSIVGMDAILPIRWAPIGLYWMIVLFLKVAVCKMSIPLWAFVLEALFSISIGIYFDWSVVCQLPELGLIAIDQSNIGFQIVAALFFAIIQIIISASVRKDYKTSFVDPYLYNLASYTYLTSSLPSERILYSYKRAYGELLPKRFQEDLLLRSIFYAIMFIEDTNRPSSARILERFLAKFDLAKTTGIMQQKSDKPLTDEESVELAIPYIEKMWNKYLRSYARSADGTIGPDLFTFSTTAYSYAYQPLAMELSNNFSLLYGDYCGTRTLMANHILDSIRRFEEREFYDFRPERIIAHGNIFPEESACFPGRILHWADGQTIETQGDNDITCRIVSLVDRSIDDLIPIIKALGNSGDRPSAITFGPANYLSIALGKK